MHRFLPYILKSLWRHRTRTVLTVGGAAVAIFVFSFVQSLQEGLDRLTGDGLADRRLIVFQANRFCPSTSRLPEDYARQIRELDGVRDAVPIKVFMNNCRASLDVVVFHGMPPHQLRTARELELASGSWTEFEQRRDGALVGQAVAQRRRITVGQRFSMGALTVTVAGIVRSPQVPADESFLYTHLEFLQRTPGLNSVGTATQIEVLLSEGADPQRVAAAIDGQFRSAQVATNTRPRGIFQSQTVGDLVELVGFLHVLAYACVGLVLALVGAATVMAVQDRTSEFAVLQTVGCSPRLVFLLVLVESTVLSMMGGTLGGLAALAALAFGNLTIGTEGVLVSFLPSATVAGAALVISAASGLLAGLSPAWTVSRAEIVPALRA